MLYIVAVSIICLFYFLMFYVFVKRLFKILCASINEYLGNCLDYHFRHTDYPPEPNTWNGKPFRISENFNHDDVEDLF